MNAFSGRTLGMSKAMTEWIYSARPRECKASIMREKLKASTNREGNSVIICERRGGKVSTNADLLFGNNLRETEVFCPGQLHFELEL